MIIVDYQANLYTNTSGGIELLTIDTFNFFAQGSGDAILDFGLRPLLLLGRWRRETAAVVRLVRGMKTLGTFKVVMRGPWIRLVILEKRRGRCGHRGDGVPASARRRGDGLSRR